MTTFRRLLAAALLLATLFATTTAAGDTLIVEEPNNHPDYLVELEPHVAALFWRRTIHRRFVIIDADAGQPEFGAGLRANLEIVDPVIPFLNNTIALTASIVTTSCSTFCGEKLQMFFPIGAQWNFYLTDKWSVYADIGLIVRTTDGFSNTFGDFLADIGGRYHFSDTVVLNARIGYPFSVTVGPGFLLGSRDD
jgi:hypothetical protein